MVTTDNLGDFVRLNDKDVEKIIFKVYPKINMFHDIEDVKQHLYLSFVRLKTIEKWDLSKGGSFSTYIYRCISNFLASYYRKQKREKTKFKECISLEYENENGSNLYNYIKIKNFEEDCNTKIRIKKILKLLEKYNDHSFVLPMSSLLKELINGERNTDTAKKFKTTLQNVILVKKRLIKEIERIEHV